MADNNDPDVLVIQKLVDAALKKPRYTYPMNVNADKPALPFASVKKIKEHNPGIDRARMEEVEGGFLHHTEGVREITFEILFTEGLEEQAKFISAFKQPEVVDYMYNANVGILRHEPVTNETLKLETNWEIRDGVRLVCLFHRQYTSDIVPIEEVEVSGVYNEGEYERNISARVVFN